MNISTLIIGLTLLAAPVAAGQLPLEELASRSGLIVMGSVASLHRPADRLLVQFAVRETLRGDPVTTVTFVAPDLWSEPAFSKQEGRPLLVFLERNSRSQPSGASSEWTLVPISADELAFFELFESDGAEYAVIWSDDLKLPPDVPVTEDTFVPDFINNVPLRPLLASLRRILNDPVDP